ncbi:MAG: CBS domain-containing protein [Deltaproteobacteria bacterium]|nr:MAG: CBS domain-containing protein [Deltaproteobacteria bacterium]
MEIITTHINADFDAMASMIAAKKLYPTAAMVFPGSQEHNLREFFVESTFYFFDFARVKDLDFSQIHRLILVDTRQAGRIGKFKSLVTDPKVDIHIYDHHPDSEDDVSGSVEVIRPVGATVTLLTEIIKKRGIALTPDEATIIALGLYEDTGSFTFTSTTPADYDAASFLLEQGANLNTVSDMLTRELTAEQISLLHDLIHSATTHTINTIPICIARASVDKYVGDFALLAHKLMDMENLNVLFALARMEDRIYVVARSRLPDVNVGEFAAAFGGGGHPSAASATIKDLTLIQVEEELFRLLQSWVNPGRQASQLMSSPVISVPPELSLQEAADLFTRYNINATPVVDEGCLVGILSRQMIDKGIYHGLESVAVRDFMSTEFSRVSPDASLIEIQEHIVDRQQRLLPVVQGEKVVGVITRKDLLNMLLNDPSRIPTYLYEPVHESGNKRRKNVANIMTEQLPRRINEVLQEAGQVAERLGYKAYAVGGFIRDLVLRRPNLDIDLVVEGDGIEFAKSLAKDNSARVRSYKKFGTAVVIFPDGFKIDVATARLEYYEYPAALPTVELSSLKLDLYRRDFTINTLAVELNPGRLGQLIDYFGAQRDFKDKAIRVLHNYSFVEDPTRVFRAIRFEQRFGFRLGRHTSNLIVNAVKMDLLVQLSGRRLTNELKLLLSEDDPAPAVRRMNEYKLFPFLHPDITYGPQTERLVEEIRSVLAWYDLSFLGNGCRRWLVYLLAVADPLGALGLEEFCHRLELPPRLTSWLLEGRARSISVGHTFYRNDDLKPSEVYHLLEGFDPEWLLFMMAKTRQEGTRRAISIYFQNLKEVRPILRGRDLQQMGIEPGPVYRQILNRLLDGRLNGEMTSREEEVEFVRQHFIEGPGEIHQREVGN